MKKLISLVLIGFSIISFIIEITLLINNTAYCYGIDANYLFWLGMGLLIIAIIMSIEGTRIKSFKPEIISNETGTIDYPLKRTLLWLTVLSSALVIILPSGNTSKYIVLPLIGITVLTICTAIIVTGIEKNTN